MAPNPVLTLFARCIHHIIVLIRLLITPAQKILLDWILEDFLLNLIRMTGKVLRITSLRF